MIKQLPLLILLAQCFYSAAQDKSLLYSIKKDGSETSYLFGTVHLIADSAFYFPAKLEKTLAKTDVLVLEISDMSNASKAMEMMTLKSGSVFDIFTPEQADSVVNWGSRQLKMKPETFRKAFSSKKPFALMQIGVQAEMMKGPVKFYEMELMGRASNNKQQVSGLETMEFQFSLFESMPDSVIAAMILSPVRDPLGTEEMSRNMVKLYADQDVEGLAKLVNDSEEISSGAEELVFNRNRNWIPVMSEKMLVQSCFFAVGAAHLGGENGVIQLLKNAGYTVTPIRY